MSVRICRSCEWIRNGGAFGYGASSSSTPVNTLGLVLAIFSKLLVYHIRHWGGPPAWYQFSSIPFIQPTNQIAGLPVNNAFYRMRVDPCFRLFWTMSFCRAPRHLQNDVAFVCNWGLRRVAHEFSLPKLPLPHSVLSWDYIDAAFTDARFKQRLTRPVTSMHDKK